MQGIGQLEFLFHALVASGSDSCIAGIFAPSLFLYSLGKYQGAKVPGCESSRERKFHTWNFRSQERMVLLLDAKSSVPIMGHFSFWISLSLRPKTGPKRLNFGFSPAKPTEILRICLRIT